MKDSVSVHVIDGLQDLVHVVLNSLLRQVVAPAFDRFIHIHVHELEDKSQSASRLVATDKKTKN